ncbi:putative RNA-binding protein EIF1AD [Nymphon striatum]|nr:putative RNA-binding protein EIF1AD [Nymphon striatum]
MSKLTKRKYVTQEVIYDFFLPEGKQEIVKMTASCGNNLHEVETAKGDRFLASMPTKFRRNVWIKKGDYVMVEPIPEGVKVKVEIIRILYKEQIKYIKRMGMWPENFVEVHYPYYTQKEKTDTKSSDNEDLSKNPNHSAATYDSDESDDCDDDLFKNTNYDIPGYESECDDDESSDNESSDNDSDVESKEESENIEALSKDVDCTAKLCDNSSSSIETKDIKHENLSHPFADLSLISEKSATDLRDIKECKYELFICLI